MFLLNKTHRKFEYILFAFCFITIFNGCNNNKETNPYEITNNNSSTRSNKANVLEIKSPGTDTIGNSHVTIDYTNASEGYLVVTYLGESNRSKLQVTGTNGITYTYDLIINEQNTIPLTSESGHYDLTLFEGVGPNQYSVLFAGALDVTIDNAYSPYLYPNQYVNFNKDSKAVSLAEQLAEGATCDLEVVSRIYKYVVENISYDHEEAENVEPGYLPDVDEVIETKKGICFDYASLMTAMLRSQSIPTKLQIGYAMDAYHAWISVYTADQGWIDGVIEFDGAKWTLMDPTFASNSKSKSKLKDFIGTGSNYVTKYTY